LKFSATQNQNIVIKVFITPTEFLYEISEQLTSGEGCIAAFSVWFWALQILDTFDQAASTLTTVVSNKFWSRLRNLALLAVVYVHYFNEVVTVGVALCDVYGRSQEVQALSCW